MASREQKRIAYMQANINRGRYYVPAAIKPLFKSTSLVDATGTMREGAKFALAKFQRTPYKAKGGTCITIKKAQ